MRTRRKWQHWHQCLTAVKADRDALRGVILYEDGPAGMTARESLQQAFPELSGSPRHPLTMWKFDMMRLSALRTSAAHDIQNADVVCVAVGSMAGLPKGVRTCLEKGLGGVFAHRRAISAQVDGVSHRLSGVQETTASYLRTIARCTRAELFVGCTSAMAATYWIIPTVDGRSRCGSEREANGTVKRQSGSTRPGVDAGSGRIDGGPARRLPVDSHGLRRIRFGRNGTAEPESENKEYANRATTQ